jgi:hypothetical protein
LPGIDPHIWQQAKLDNPDPEKMIPVPMTGFSDLNSRLQLQEVETTIQQSRLEVSRLSCTFFPFDSMIRGFLFR